MVEGNLVVTYLMMVVGSGSPFASTDDAEGCGYISLLCSSIWNIYKII